MSPRLDAQLRPNANTFLGPNPVKVPVPQKTMPSEIDGPALQAPPLSKDHRGAPVLASSAYMVPRTKSRLQPKITPFAPLTAPSARLPRGSAVVQRTAPVLASSEAQPPARVVVPSCSVHSSAPKPPPLRAEPLLDAATNSR